MEGSRDVSWIDQAIFVVGLGCFTLGGGVAVHFETSTLFKLSVLVVGAATFWFGERVIR